MDQKQVQSFEKQITDALTSLFRSRLPSVVRNNPDLERMFAQKISHTEGDLIHVKNGNPSADGHTQFRMTKTHDGLDKYNLGVDESPIKTIISQEGGVYRSAVVLSDSNSSGKTAFGISTSDNQGGTWTPSLTVSNNGNVAIASNLLVNGTINGRNPTVDGAKLDSMSDLTAENIGQTTDSVGVFHQKVGTKLQLKTLRPGSAALSINTTAEQITIDIDPTKIPINRLSSGEVTNSEFDRLAGVTAPIQDQLNNRALVNHSHSSNDIIDFDEKVENKVDARLTMQKSVPGGLATLDVDGKVPASQLKVDGGLVYKGSWDALTNNPIIRSGIGTIGNFYVVRVPGSTNLDGVGSWQVGDTVMFGGLKWERFTVATKVNSVAGRQGDILLAAEDILSGTFAPERISMTSVKQYETSLEIGNLIGSPSSAVVGVADLQTLTNKNLTDKSNQIRATRLATTGDDVMISNASPGTVGGVLTLTSSTTAEWQSIPTTFQSPITYARASFQSEILNPVGTSSIHGVMMGLAGSITPLFDGRVSITVTGSIRNASNNRGGRIQIRYGTGPGPTNGSSIVGIAAGTPVQMINSNNSPTYPFTLSAVVVGLSIETTYWIDVSLVIINGGTVTLSSVGITATE